MLRGIIGISLYIILGYILLPLVIEFMKNHRITAPNFKNLQIPLGLGLYLWMMLMIYFILMRWMWKENFSDMNLMYTYVIALTVVFIMGWMDDTVGDKQVKGIGGHWGKWKDQRIVTTGLLKAGITIVLALWIVMEFNSSWLTGVVQFCLIVLMTNALNLFDLRPGRSLKAFFLLVLLWISVVNILGSRASSLFYIVPVVISALLLFPKDLHGEVMLGDAGSNFLGFAVGFCIALSSPIWFQMMMVVFLIWIHWIAAKSSITSKIESSLILNWIDRAGRIS